MTPTQEVLVKVQLLTELKEYIQERTPLPQSGRARNRYKQSLVDRIDGILMNIEDVPFLDDHGEV